MLTLISIGVAVLVAAMAISVIRRRRQSGRRSPVSGPPTSERRGDEHQA